MIASASERSPASRRISPSFSPLSGEEPDGSVWHDAGVPRRLPWILLLASVALNAVYGAVAGILVPAQIAAADPDNRALTLGLVMAASSALTLAVHPLAGALSDRTRSRWGRRAPWIAVGALACGVGMVVLGAADTVMAIGLGWLILQPLLNVVEAPLDAIAADRVPSPRRPRVAAAIGTGAALGLAAGAVFAGLGSGAIATTYLAFALFFVVSMVAVVVLAPDRQGTVGVGVRPRLRARDAWRSPALRRVFLARFLLVLGHQLVLGYVLYIVIAVADVDVAEAGRITSGLLGAHIVCVLLGALVAARGIRGSRIPWIVGATCLIAAGLVVPLAWPSLTGLAVYAAVAGVGRGLYLAADLALMIDVLPSPADNGRDLGVLALATILPQTVAPALAGLAVTATGGSYSILFALAVAGVLASVPVVLRVREPSPSSP
jgi:MFS family permease